MAVSIEDIKKLRAMTGAGLADVKKALTEAEGDFDKAKELLRERGLAIAAKRSDRETSNGCVLVKKVNDFAAIIALKVSQARRWSSTATVFSRVRTSRFTTI